MQIEYAYFVRKDSVLKILGMIQQGLKEYPDLNDI